MADATSIEWTDATWNPVTGCTKISAGCDNCYAERFSERFRGTPGHPFENGFDLTLRPERLERMYGAGLLALGVGLLVLGFRVPGFRVMRCRGEVFPASTSFGFGPPTRPI